MSEHITPTPAIKRLERSSTDRFLAGVCGGLGRYFDLSPALFRLGLVVLTLVGGAGILVYIAAVLVIPAEGKDTSIAEDVLRDRNDRPARLVGLALVGVAIAVLLSRADAWPTAGAAWLLVLLAGLILLWTTRERRVHRIVIAMVTLVATLILAAVVAVVVAFAWFDVSLDDGIGDRRYSPTLAADVKPVYEHGIGDMRIDLSRLQSKRPTHVTAHLGIGLLKITVPRDAAVVVDARAKAGDIDALDHHDDGRDAHVASGTLGRIVIDADIGAGHIEVVRAG